MLRALDGYGARIVRVAQSYRGSREIGNNGGPLVTRMLRYVGVNHPAPWCTAAAVNILHEAAMNMGAQSTCPKVASGAKLWRWALRNPDKATLIHASIDLRPGDVVIQGSTVAKTRRIVRGGLASGHTWIAGEMTEGVSNLLHGGHISYEGNTNKRGAREGQGFYQRERMFDSSRVVGAIRFQALYDMGSRHE